MIPLMKQGFCRVALLLWIIAVFAGCQTHDEYSQERRQRLLEIYPPNRTTRPEVQAKWGNAKPDFSLERPKDGWAKLAVFSVNGREANIGFFINQALRAEKRTAKTVYRMERYRGVDGISSLCYCWFYYDENDKLVDAEWQYMSD